MKSSSVYYSISVSLNHIPELLAVIERATAQECKEFPLHEGRLMAFRINPVERPEKLNLKFISMPNEACDNAITAEQLGKAFHEAVKRFKRDMGQGKILIEQYWLVAAEGRLKEFPKLPPETSNAEVAP